MPPKSEPWRDFGDLPLTMLKEQSISDLRKYAANVLHIVGASKIKGGKSVLLERIQQGRGVQKVA